MLPSQEVNFAWPTCPAFHPTQAYFVISFVHALNTSISGIREGGCIHISQAPKSISHGSPSYTYQTNSICGTTSTTSEFVVSSKATHWSFDSQNSYLEEPSVLQEDVLMAKLTNNSSVLVPTLGLYELTSLVDKTFSRYISCSSTQDI